MALRYYLQLDTRARGALPIQSIVYHSVSCSYGLGIVSVDRTVAARNASVHSFNSGHFCHWCYGRLFSRTLLPESQIEPV